MDYVSKRINVVFSSKDTEKLLNVYIRSRKCFLFLEQQSLDLVFSGVCVTQSLLYSRSPGGGEYTVLPLSVHPRYFSSHFSQ